MTKAVANVSISTDTFAGWLGKTNILLDSLSNEIVTVDDTTAGSNSIGNGSIIGTFSANTLGAFVLRGGGVGNTANVSTITVGISNSTVSSNVVISGYTANVTANAFNILSNLSIAATSASINVASLTAQGNLVFGTNTSHTNILSGNTTTINSVSASITSNTYVQAANVYVNATAFTITGTNTVINSSITFTGAEVFTSANLAITGTNTSISSTNTAITGGVLNVSSNSNFTGTVTSTGNVYLNTSNVTVNTTSTTLSGTQTTISSNLNITAANTTTSKLTVANTITVQSNTYVNNTIYFGQNKSAFVQTVNNVIFPGDGVTSNIVASYALSDFNSGKFTINVVDNSNSNNKLITELTAVNGYDNINSTEYGTIFSNTRFMTFSLSSNATHFIINGVSNSTVVNTNVVILSTMFS